ncbi:hypothetical protein J2W95_002899 [Flavobacterium granuli]|uniref:Uncharacterized protein n=1 Tax=Flavobacterium granuli TaxID=280093 RepID=A0ABU1S570_9FLAO|nr:hypothetical protein [Flavobacterium granuli]
MKKKNDNNYVYNSIQEIMTYLALLKIDKEKRKLSMLLSKKIYGSLQKMRFILIEEVTDNVNLALYDFDETYSQK